MLFLIIFFSCSGWAQFIEVPVNHSAKEAMESRSHRQQLAIDYYAKAPLALPPLKPQERFHEFVMTTIARMISKKDLEAVSENILRKDFRPWNTGTEIKVLGNLCKRNGDFDFTMMGLLRMAYLDHESGQALLSPEARKKLLHVLLYEKGNKHHLKFQLENCLPLKIKDTENHILMTEISRYLTNQLLFKESGNEEFDNTKNGFEDWFVNHLSEFLYRDFDELNSRPYQGLTLIALANLYSYAEGPRVKLVAQMVLDYLSAKTAVQTMGLRRYSPFRRRLENREPKSFLQADAGMWWFSFHAGNPDFKLLEDSPIEDYIYFMAATDRYELPKLIHETFYAQEKAIFQRVLGRDPEAYYLSKNFLLTAGGRFRKVFGYFTQENHVWGTATTIIPRSSGMNLSQVFSMNGPDKWARRNNLCVAPNFACGTNLKIPSDLKDLGIKEGPWLFFDLKDFQLAVYQKGIFAFWEVQEKGDFETFKKNVLLKNPKEFSGTGSSVYRTSDGHEIEFVLRPQKPGHYPILSYDGVKQLSDTKKWPQAQGDLINAQRDGVIVVTSPNSLDKLILNISDLANPKREYVSGSSLEAIEKLSK